MPAPAVYSIPEITGVFEGSEIDPLRQYEHIIVLENHNPARAKNFHLGSQLESNDVEIHRLGLEGLPANGQPAEVLAHHHLDAQSIAEEVARLAGHGISASAKIVSIGETYTDRESH